MFQFGIMMTAAIAAAYYAVRHVGGLDALVAQLSTPRPTPDGEAVISYLNFLPDFHNNWEIAVAVFVVPIAVQWWSVWYPGSEPGGGTFIAQRMLASKSERDSLGAVLFFNLAHYVLRPWPWILVALASLLVYPELSDIRREFPGVHESLIGHDMAYPAMLKFLPVGFIGLMVAGLIAANSSTVLSLLNLGSAYLVHDFYRRFLRPGAEERHYVRAGRITTIGLFICSSATVYALETAKDTFDLMLQVGAGSGLLYLLRWFWWRVNAWSEVVAMAVPFVISVVLFVLKRNGSQHSSTDALLITVSITTLCWVLTAICGPKTDKETLIAFYRKVRPFGPGWARIRAMADIGDEAETGRRESVPLALLGWVAGCVMVWTSLFTVGSFLYGRTVMGFVLLTVFMASGLTLIGVIRRLWSAPSSDARAAAVSSEVEANH
jgi:SSS family solute:Na+ symporter